MTTTTSETKPLPRCKIIAEFTSNHLGDDRILAAMLQEARRVGVDTVKFQSWQADQLRKDFPDYAATYTRHKGTELNDAQHRQIVAQCQELGLEFLTTCFDLNRVDFLASLGLPAIKVASPDALSWRLIDRLMAKFPTVIISTGLITHEELETLVGRVDKARVILLHCVSLYPAPLDRLDLARLDWLRERGFRVGFSDHTSGTEAAMLAMARGAEIVEKHFTLSRALPGKDQAMSATPDIFEAICRWRDLCRTMLGTPVHTLNETEWQIRKLYVGKWGDNK